MDISTQIWKIGEEIYEISQNTYCTPLEFFVEENFDICDPKIHGPRNYLLSFYFSALIQKCGENSLLFFCRDLTWYY